MADIPENAAAPLPQFRSRPIFGEAAQGCQQFLGDERVLRTADRVLETDYSATTQQQRWDAQQQGRSQYAPRSEKFPGTPQFTPGVKAAYVAGTVSQRAAVGGSTMGLLGAATMPGKWVGGSYDGAPATETNRYFEKAGTFILCVTWTLIGLGFMVFSVAVHIIGHGEDAGIGICFSIFLGAIPALAGVLVWYLTCRTNRKEAQVVGAVAMLGAAALGRQLGKMSEPPRPDVRAPKPSMRNTDGSWNPLGGNQPYGWTPPAQQQQMAVPAAWYDPMSRIPSPGNAKYDPRAVEWYNAQRQAGML